MHIKICGLREKQNIREVVALEPDSIGFIFYPLSSRYAGEELEPEFIRSLSENPVKTAVFVDEDLERVEDIVNIYGFQAVQLHGIESPMYCRSLKDTFKEKLTLIKAFGISENFDFDMLESYSGFVDFFMFDTKTPLKGGSGKTFDWELLHNYRGTIPFWLSGGIGLAELNELKDKAADFPALYGFDLNSRLELSPGLKNIDQVRQAIQEVRAIGRV